MSGTPRDVRATSGALPERRRLRPRVAVALPNGFTLANLFFGIFAIVAASRGDFDAAARFIVFGGIADALDGRIARATKSGSRFGEELDSLVDAISFGTAPALIMYFAVFQSTRWEWIFCFFFTACAVMRLARFNVESAGKAKAYFKGLPSPAAGGTLATYYWFSQTSLYNETFIGNWPWEVILRFLMAGLGFLMISNVPFPGWPKFTFKTVHGTAAIIVFVSSIFALFFLPKEFFFPFGVLYVITGVVLAVVRGVLELPSPFDEPDELGENGESLVEEPQT